MRSVPPAPQFKPFLFSYRYEGAEWNVEIPARSWEDAKRRAMALAHARCEGELLVRIPAYAGFVARIGTIIRNAWQRSS